MKNEIKLTEAEIATITAGRETAAAIKTQHELHVAKKAAAAAAKEAADKDTWDGLYTALVEADTDNVFNHAAITFRLGGRDEPINIEYHTVYSRDSYSGRTKGMKYRLTGQFNNNSDRYYTDPKTVIRKIAEYQAEEKRLAKAKEDHATLAQRAEAEKAVAYPFAEVTYEKGYDYRAGKKYGGSASDYKPDTIKVKTERGSIAYSFYQKGDGTITFNPRERIVSEASQLVIDKLILG